MSSDFAAAFARTLGHEGGYSCDPVDRGGETYRGISRVNWPAWAGWKVVDSLRHMTGFPGVLSAHFDLDALVRQFYRERFWDYLRAGDLSQAVAEELFDSAVNCGVRTAVKWLQRACNAMNRAGTAWPDVAIDGVMGSDALSAALAATADNERLLVKIMNVCQGAHYLALMERDPRQERFCRGWFSRVA